VINQAVRPGYCMGDVLYLMRVMLFITLLSMGYVLSQPDLGARKEAGVLLPDTTPEWPGILPWQRRASVKAVQKYAEVQERKWRRWNEVMFERSS